MVHHGTKTHSLLFLGFTQSSDSRSDGSSGCGGVHPGTAGYDALAPLAGPDTNAGAFHRILKIKHNKKLIEMFPKKLMSKLNVYLSTERASVLAVLGDFDLLHHLTQGSTITGTIFTGDSDLLGALCL